MVSWTFKGKPTKSYDKNIPIKNVIMLIMKGNLIFLNVVVSCHFLSGVLPIFISFVCFLECKNVIKNEIRNQIIKTIIFSMKKPVHVKDAWLDLSVIAINDNKIQNQHGIPYNVKKNFDFKILFFLLFSLLNEITS